MKVKFGGTSGYSLLEVMMAMMVMTIGLTSLLALFSQSVVTMYLVQEELIAKQKSREALESIYTARDTQLITFDMIQNDPAGVFLAGFQPLRLPNPTSGGGDGLVGTADDGAVETLTRPGPDGQLGTSDDLIRPLTNFDRQIEIDPVLMSGGDPYPDLRQITITVRYTTSQGWQRSYRVASYISRYR
ncbi:prepilin-type N-terminal cleavage/methylation domain-containing protein [Acidobacteria bacterium AH-259-L09]|nr:prepilin-type N-terminal cleavage/methylation domain-containing protein [Acidobacteria bacterium AH-259-L09]